MTNETSHLVPFGYVFGTSVKVCPLCQTIGWNQDMCSSNCRVCAEKQYWATMEQVKKEYPDDTLLEFRRSHENKYGQYCDNSDFVEVATKILVEDRGRQRRIHKRTD